MPVPPEERESIRLELVEISERLRRKYGFSIQEIRKELREILTTL